jgi:hypothetical protein
MKYYKEITYQCREHKIESIVYIEPIEATETTDAVSGYWNARVLIYHEGIDGDYFHEVPVNDNDLAVGYLVEQPDLIEKYGPFEIIEA